MNLTIGVTIDPLVQEIAILCLGHLATLHQTFDLAAVLPVLQTYTSRPDLASAIQRACDDIAFLVKDTSYFEDHWTELPDAVKESLIQNHIFNRQGKLKARQK